MALLYCSANKGPNKCNLAIAKVVNQLLDEITK